jgi:SulP family sulfate permease
MHSKEFHFHPIKDALAGLYVFLVALPLCLGIAQASGAPLFAGLIAGIIGGLVISLLSGSPLSVSGPAAGLTTIVAAAILKLGGYEVLLTAIMLSGIIQLILGLAKAGLIAQFFPSNVIKGMLAAIGIKLMIKEISNAIGYTEFALPTLDIKNPADNHFFSWGSDVIHHVQPGSIIVSGLSALILLTWSVPFLKFLKRLPVSFIIVAAGIMAAFIIHRMLPSAALAPSEYVHLPVAHNANEFINFFQLPDFTKWQNPQLWITAATLAIVASLESLLSIEAIDKLDSKKRISNPNKELVAQGLGNVVSGLVGGLPVTAVIVRGSANIQAGAQSRYASFFHGLFLLLAVIFLASFINLIPQAALAILLIVVGYKLCKWELFQSMWKAGLEQFIPFAVTLIAIVATDLLEGIAIGMMVAIFYILRMNTRNAFSYHVKDSMAMGSKTITITLAEELSFLSKAKIAGLLEGLQDYSHVIIDGSHSRYIHYDIIEMLQDYSSRAKSKHIHFELKQIIGKDHIENHVRH